MTISEDSSSVYWVSLSSQVSRKSHEMPLIITVAVFRQQGGEILWELLPMTTQMLNSVAIHKKRVGAITAKVHDETDMEDMIHNVTKMLRAPMAKEASFVVFCQNGEISEKFLDVVRQEKRLRLEVR